MNHLPRTSSARFAGWRRWAWSSLTLRWSRPRPPLAGESGGDPARLADHGMNVVGHAYYLPFASAFDIDPKSSRGGIAPCLEVSRRSALNG